MSGLISCSCCMMVTDFLHNVLSPLLHSKGESYECQEQSLQGCMLGSVESVYQRLNPLNIWIGDLEMILAG